MAAWLLSPFAIACWTTLLALVLVAQFRFGAKISFSLFVVGAGILVSSYLVTSIPLPAQVDLTAAAEVFDRHGRLIGTYDEVRRFIIDTHELPQHVGDAVIAAEDRDFFDHGGVAYKGVIRAAVKNILGGKISQGGSTITQQYVKVALLQDPSRTVTRKLREAVLASKLEDRYTKEQILAFYLNTIYLGRGSYGIEAAARTYFDKRATELSLSEAAYIAGIIRSPENYQLDRNRNSAEARWRDVLAAMKEMGSISRREARRALVEPPRLAAGVDERAQKQQAAYFLEWLRRDHLEAMFGDCLYSCGLKIHTTLDLRMQRHAEHAVAEALGDKGDPRAALVAMSPGGEVRALVGGTNFHSSAAASGFNLATDFPGRHAGSAFKPFALAAALEEGISPVASFSGASPFTARGGCGNERSGWSVSNYGGASYGYMSLGQATATSVNTIYARLMEQVGPRPLARVAKTMGFGREGTSSERTIEPLCSLALGSIDVTTLEMARAYAAFPAEGLLPEVRPITYVEDRTGQCLKAFVTSKRDCDDTIPPAPKRVMSAGSATAVTRILTQTVTSGTGAAADIGRIAAGKTGTSQNNTDAWFVGYVPQLVGAVWVGHPIEDDGTVPQLRRCRKRICRPVDGQDVTGGSIPAQIWATFMKGALRDIQVKNFWGVRPTRPPAPFEAGGPIKPPLPSASLTPEIPAGVEPDPSPSPSPTSRPLIVLPTPL